MKRDEEMELLFEDSQIFGFWVTDKKGNRIDPLEYIRKTTKQREDETT